MNEQEFATFIERILTDVTKNVSDEDDTSRTESRSNNYIERLEKMLDDFEHRNKNLKSQLTESKLDKKNAERKLKLFMKAAARIDAIDKMQAEMKHIIREEQDHIKFATFFGIQTKQLEEFEDNLEEFHDFNH